MKEPEEGGSRIAVVFNGSPLFAGGPNSGESAIRRWIIENDWLEGIIGLPKNLFYNTGINTYLWIISNNKSDERKEKIQLVDGQDMYSEMEKSLGEKRYKLNENHISKLTNIFGDLEANGRSKVFSKEEFGYRRIVIDQPLRQSFQATDDRIESLEDERAFTNRDKETQEAVKNALKQLDSEMVWMDRDVFRKNVKNVFEDNNVSVRKSVHNAIERALGERDANAEICTNNNGEPEHDTDLRIRERVPLGQDPHDYFQKEVDPYVENAWINDNSKYCDEKDGEVGIVGYEINFNRHFYDFEIPRDISEINTEIAEIEEKIASVLEEI